MIAAPGRSNLGQEPDVESVFVRSRFVAACERDGRIVDVISLE